MRRYCLIAAITVVLTTGFATWVGAYPWGINYVPTTDTYHPMSVSVQGWFAGHTDYAWSDPVTGLRYKESFKESSFQYFVLNFGLPTLSIGGWIIDADIGISHTEPDSSFYDETHFDAKVRFVQDSQFSSWSPSLAVGAWYLGGRVDLDAYEHYSADGDYDHPDATHPCFYLVASKYIAVPRFTTELTAGFMWNNYGIDEEDVVIAGFMTALGTERVWLCCDYYGGDFGAYGVSLFCYLTKDIWLQPIYFHPVDRNYHADDAASGLSNVCLKDYNSPSIWTGLYVNFQF